MGQGRAEGDSDDEQHDTAPAVGHGRSTALPGLGDKLISAAAVQVASLAAVSDLFGVVVPSAGDIPG
jgi:hypothetical protein